MPLTFRLYVCSHFTDTKAERDHLHAVVFPALRRLLADSGSSLEVLDLRHGAASEAEDPMRLPEALHEIDECRPWFLCLLGDRLGADRPRERYTWNLHHPTLAPAVRACLTALRDLEQAEPG